MRTVWKYPIKLEAEVQWIEMPAGAKFLSFAFVPCGLAAWFEINTEQKIAHRGFLVVGTGHHLPAYYRHRGTAFQPGKKRTFVWHLYELDIPRGPGHESISEPHL